LERRCSMKRFRGAVLGFCLAVESVAWPYGPAAPAPRPAKLRPDLFLAIGTKDLRTVKALLNRGADPNGGGSLSFTPLMFAAVCGQEQIAAVLLAAGAEVDATSRLGTALTFAEMGGHDRLARLLLARGARVDPPRLDGMTVLMLAARSGHTGIVRQLLADKTSVNASDSDGMTALMYAARAGRCETARLLLRAGAAVNAADSHRWTALTYAAAIGHADVARLLLEHGAEADRRDEMERTPLLIAASYGDQPAVLRALLDGGADLQARDSKNRTALTIAVSRGNEANAQILREEGADPGPQEEPAPQKSIRAAIAASLSLLERSMRVFSQRTGCVSCHHEGIGRLATGLARQRGLAIDATLAKSQARRVEAGFASERPLVLEALKDPRMTKEIPEAQYGELVPTYVFRLAGLAAHDQPADPTLSSAALLLARQQSADGDWRFVVQRGQIQSSRFTMTALTVRMMQAYAPKDRAAEMAWRTRRARKWLQRAPAETTEDLAFRLLGLKWTGASREARLAAVAALRAAQRAGGGWATRPSRKSDAYATGEALFALNQGGGVPVTDPAYRRGVQFLLRNQEDDGSWFVNKEAMPALIYFDAGFPHGQSQFISYAATSWATMALLLSVDGPALAHR
jgi:ankyrin repeat protein